MARIVEFQKIYFAVEEGILNGGWAGCFAVAHWG